MHGQNINKQMVNIADGNLTDYSFLSRYHYTKSKNYLKRRYQICHSIPMFIKTPCRNKSLKITELCLALMLMASKIHRFDFVPHASATATA